MISNISHTSCNIWRVLEFYFLLVTPFNSPGGWNFRQTPEELPDDCSKYNSDTFKIVFFPFYVLIVLLESPSPF